MSREYWIALAIVAGTGLILNPLYLYPDGGGRERTYEVEKIQTESEAEIAIIHSERVVECPGLRLCAAEERVLTNSSIVYNGHLDSFEGSSIQNRDPGWYPVLRIDGKPYLPKHENIKNGTVLKLADISNLQAVEYTAIPAEERAAEVREAIEAGSITVYGDQIQAFEHDEILAHKGEYYRSGGVTGNTHWSGTILLELFRAILYVSGIALVFISGWWFHDK